MLDVDVLVSLRLSKLDVFSQDRDMASVQEGDDHQGARRCGGTGGMSAHHATGLRKLKDAIEWLKDTVFHRSSEEGKVVDDNEAPAKWVLFAHHRDVMDALQGRLLEGTRNELSTDVCVRTIFYSLSFAGGEEKQ